jgi:glycosyltransferase involved in cell wall biosynthesis
MDERDAPAHPRRVNAASKLRVGLDLDGSLESLGNSMTDLADALTQLDECDLVRFRTHSRVQSPNERSLALRTLWAPLWRRGLGRSLDDLLPAVDVIHLAGLATPPTRRTPLIISVDDLRPLREESRIHQRITQLQRAASRGATLVASSATASHEVRQVLGVKRSRVVVVPPAVPSVALTTDGHDLVVNVTGLTDWFLVVAPGLVAFAESRGAQLVALTSATAVTVRSRSEARAALAQARVVMHFSDGARFPSFAIAALAAGVPTIARSTPINRELLEGAAELVAQDDEFVATLDEVWHRETRRAIMIAAGRSRADDFAPATAARAYAALYRDVVRGWNS